MKSTTPKEIAILIALFTSIVCGVVLVLTFDFDRQNFYLTVVLSCLSLFLLTYIFCFLLLSRFILEKIKPIYRTIHSMNISDETSSDHVEERNIVEDVGREVDIWAKRKAMEISHLKEMEKYRKEFVGNVSHELKTPIFNIQGYVLTLLDGALEDSNINRKYLERTEKSINRLISIVEDLEEISKLEAGVLKLAKDKFNLVSLVEEVFESQEIRAKDKKIKLRFDESYEKPIWVKADKQKIYQVITNLVVNSINYGRDGGKTTISFIDMMDRVLVEVADNGIGIPTKELPRVFERFYRVDKSRSRDQGGTGLGLAIVKHIIEAHEQSINVRSSVNEGTTFGFTLKRVV